MKESVAAVIVTYNRKALLSECLQGVLRQTVKPSKIYLIDNHSTDGTPEYLQETGLLKNEALTYVRLPSNIGGAGGFYEGCKLAYEAGHDWLWLMDDDVVPADSALEIQLNYGSISKCIHPRKMFEDGSFFEWEQVFFPKFAEVFSLKEVSFKNGKDWCVVNVGCFEGMLLHRSLIPKIGLPDPRFFLGYDDTIYGFMASLHTNSIYVRDAVFLKKIVPSPAISELKIYYLYRNYFLKLEYLEKLGLSNRFYSNLLNSLSIFKLLIASLRQGKFFKVLRALYYSYKDAYSKNFGLGTFKI